MFVSSKPWMCWQFSCLMSNNLSHWWYLFWSKQSLYFYDLDLISRLCMSLKEWAGNWMIMVYLFQCKFVYICCLFRVVHLSSYTYFSVKQSPADNFVKYLNIIDLLLFSFLFYMEYVIHLFHKTDYFLWMTTVKNIFKKGERKKTHCIMKRPRNLRFVIAIFV